MCVYSRRIVQVTWVWVLSCALHWGVRMRRFAVAQPGLLHPGQTGKASPLPVLLGAETGMLARGGLQQQTNTLLEHKLSLRLDLK